MREIKFRAWDNKISAYVIPAHTMNIHTGQISDIPERFILEQFTGLIDKNGREIYDGDIVLILYTDWPSKTSDDKRTLDEYLDSISLNGVVEYTTEYGWAGFCIRFKDGNTGCIGCGTHGRITVVGNIHEVGL